MMAFSAPDSITTDDGPPPPDSSWTWHRLAGPLFKALDVAGTHWDCRARREMA